ncbi:MAG: inorganic diphosphatase [Pseudomonadota bacterium]
MSKKPNVVQSTITERILLFWGQEVFVPLCVAYAKPIGVMRMLSQGEADDKIIAVHAHDPEFTHFNSIKELSPHRTK